MDDLSDREGSEEAARAVAGEVFGATLVVDFLLAMLTSPTTAAARSPQGVHTSR